MKKGSKKKSVASTKSPEKIESKVEPVIKGSSFETPTPVVPTNLSVPTNNNTKNKNSTMKNLAVIVLCIVLVLLAYHFITYSDNNFIPGSPTDSETFKSDFNSANLISIVMDGRGVTDQSTLNNILQCGVDFAGSSGMGGKKVNYFSISNENCAASDGFHNYKYCFSKLPEGLTIYVKEGTTGTTYYDNGMVVTVGKNYTLGTCGIKRV